LVECPRLPLGIITLAATLKDQGYTFFDATGGHRAQLGPVEFHVRRSEHVPAQKLA
jgi:hypothetical protein